MIETAVHAECSVQARVHARNALLECFSDERVSTYAKYRLLHHLVRRLGRQNGRTGYRRIQNLPSAARECIRDHLPLLLGELALDLNLITLYAMQALGASHAELEAAVQNHCPKPVAVPIRNALFLAAEPARPARMLEPAAAIVDEEVGETY